MRSFWIVLMLLAMSLSCARMHRELPYSAVQPVNKRLPFPVMERQVRNAVDAGDGDYQIRSLRERMAAHPDDLEIRLQLAIAYRQRGYPELALDHYRLASSRFPDSNGVQLLLAKALREAGMRKEAVESLENFLNTHPQKTPELLSWTGILRDELGQYAKGEIAHEAAVALSPYTDYLHNNLGYCLLLQGKKERAAEEFRLALQLRPDSTTARNNLGMALASKPQEAVLHWQTVSDWASAHSNMAAVFIEQGRFEEARKELDLALGYNKSHQAALKNLKLVSQLDGKPAVLPIKSIQERRARHRKNSGGPEPDRKEVAVSTRSQNRRGQ